jgi:hypothetical protein
MVTKDDRLLWWIIPQVQEIKVKPLRIMTLVLVLATAASIANAQSPTQSAPASPPAGPMGSMPMHHPAGTHQMPATAGGAMMMHGSTHRAGMPTEPGQAAFGTVQEIVGMLQADPATNWSKVDIDALRQHLIDMDEVTMRADAQKEPIENGLRIAVTGSGRTLEAIQRMLPAHAQDINGLYGWTVQAKTLPNGEELTVTASNTNDVQKIRGLGFMGIMVLGTHQMHHLAMAKGEPMHMQ